MCSECAGELVATSTSHEACVRGSSSLRAQVRTRARRYGASGSACMPKLAHVQMCVPCATATQPSTQATYWREAAKKPACARAWTLPYDSTSPTSAMRKREGRSRAPNAWFPGWPPELLPASTHSGKGIGVRFGPPIKRPNNSRNASNTPIGVSSTRARAC